MARLPTHQMASTRHSKLWAEMQLRLLADRKSRSPESRLCSRRRTDQFWGSNLSELLVPTPEQIAVGDRGQVVLRNGFEQGLEFIPLPVLIDLPAVEVEVRHSAVAGNVLQRADELRYPRHGGLENCDVLVSPTEVLFQQTVPELNVRRISIGVGADIPQKGILWEIVDEVPAGASSKETGFPHLGLEPPVELPAWITEGDNLVPEGVF